MRVIVDAMGSDNAPGPDVEGAIRAARRFGCRVVLVGREDPVRAELAKHDISGLLVELVHAADVVEMHEHPAQAVCQKDDASVVVGMRLLRDGEGDAFVSAGNSGGVLASALVGAGGSAASRASSGLPSRRCCRTCTGIRSCWISAPMLMPNPSGWCSSASWGDLCRARAGHHQPRGSACSPMVRRTPRETPWSRRPMPCCEVTDLNFAATSRAKDITEGKADVIVSDGFAGNVAIKTAEGTASMILTILKREIKARPLRQPGSALAKPAFKVAASTLDYREYGGGRSWAWMAW